MASPSSRTPFGCEYGSARPRRTPPKPLATAPGGGRACCSGEPSRSAAGGWLEGQLVNDARSAVTRSAAAGMQRRRAAARRAAWCSSDADRRLRPTASRVNDAMPVRGGGGQGRRKETGSGRWQQAELSTRRATAVCAVTFVPPIKTGLRLNTSSLFHIMAAQIMPVNRLDFGVRQREQAAWRAG